MKTTDDILFEEIKSTKVIGTLLVKDIPLWSELARDIVKKTCERYVYFNAIEQEIYTQKQVKELFDNYKNELLKKIYHAHSRDAVLTTEIPIKANGKI